MSDDGRPDADADMNTDADADTGTNDDAEEADWETTPDSDVDFPTDPEHVAFPREITNDIYGESPESRQVSTTLYRVSDLYDPDGDTSSEEIYLNVRHTMGTKVQGGIDR